MSGQLHIIVGCMYSGKSTELLKIIKNYRILEKKILCINHSIDTRYGTNHIISHDKNTEECTQIDKLININNSTDYKNCEILVIEEAQFFEDLYDFVINAVYKDNKIIYIAGLDGDYKKELFGDIYKLIPHCDTIKKLSALCIICKDGTPGNFTKRIVDDNNQKLIGSIESYIPVCRKHHV